MRQSILVAFAFISISVLAMLVSQTNAINPREHEQYNADVRAARDLADDMFDLVRDARRGSGPASFAALDSVQSELKALFPDLRQVPRFVRRPVEDSLTRVIAKFEVSASTRIRLAEAFESANAPLQIALDSIAVELRALVRAAAPQNALALSDGGSRWLTRARRSGNRSRIGQDSALLALRALSSSITGGNAGRLAGVLARMESVRPLIVTADSLVDAIDDTPAYELGTSARDVYRAEFEFAEAHANRAMKWLALYAAFLVAVLCFVFYRLQRSRALINAANDDLEVKVHERTAELEQVIHELARARDDALQASIAKSQFLANMSHELRTPLNSVIGFTNILLKNKRNSISPQELTFLTRIVENGRHLLSLINDVLDLSKIEAGKVEVESVPMQIDQMTRETVQQFGSDPRNNGVQLHAVIPAQVQPMLGDQARLKQVLINLVGNALKFTEKGSVTVALRTDAVGRPERIDVIDTGIGIPGDRLAAIFEAFQQADASTSRRFGGTGLGLAISSSLAQLMGCRIDVQSVIGEGTTFSVVLPKTQGQVDAPASSAPAIEEPPVRGPVRPVNSNRELVLIIDDDADSRVLMTQMLEDANYEVIAANAGSQGLRMAREFRPRAILLDLMMPGMSGFDVLKELKQDSDLCHIPVVVVSIVARDYAGSLLGAVDLVEKPLSRDELITAVERNVNRPVHRILVVDDSGDDRRLISSFLTRSDVVVDTAANAAEALEILVRAVPDAVVVDLLMPGMGGAECARLIKSNPKFADLPVVIVTAKDLSSHEVARLKAVTSAVLSKGEDLERDLKLALQGCLRLSSHSDIARAVAKCA
jgi:signal transduction histidine kinase/CheY-like chemotaxis protein